MLSSGDGRARVPTGNHTGRNALHRRVANVAGIGKKIKEAAMRAARDRVSGGKKGGRAGGSGGGADVARKAIKSFLK